MKTYFLLVISVTLTVSVSRAGVTEYTDAQAWQSAVEDYSTIDFTGFADGTPINNQYNSLGVTFTGPEFIFLSAIFVNDGAGLHGPAGIHVHFDSVQNWIAVDYPGGVRFQLFNQGELIYTSTFFQPGGAGNFAGLVSYANFDEAYLFRPPPFDDQAFIDDLHWGAPVPAPGALVVLGLAVLFKAGRRRR